MNKRPAIPTLRSGAASVDRYAEAVKQAIDSMTGQLKNSEALVELAPTATLPEVIAALNVVVRRLQGK